MHLKETEALQTKDAKVIFQLAILIVLAFILFIFLKTILADERRIFICGQKYYMLSCTLSSFRIKEKNIKVLHDVKTYEQQLTLVANLTDI